VNFTPDVSCNSREKLNIQKMKIHRRTNRSARQSDMRGNNTIVIVDDDPALRTLIKIVLQSERFDVLDFANPVEALIALRKTSVEISAVISDIDMPGMDGVAFARVVRKHLPCVPVLLISGLGAGETRESSFSFLGKPFGPSALIHAVRELLALSPEVNKEFALP
jgi:two-component system, cell cycle sensor histidine kinase and response regulator CckA